jgi:hypothetical protein
MNNKYKTVGCDNETYKIVMAESKRFRELLAKVLEADLKNVLEIVESDYDSPSWAHKQAHRNGKEENIRTVLKLLE